MKKRIVLLAVSMSWLVGGAALAAGGAVPGLPAAPWEPAPVSSPGCGRGAATNAEAAPALGLQPPKSINLTADFCGDCSTSQCAGQPVDLPCWIGGTTGWGRCIPPGFWTCPGGVYPDVTWQCQCTTEYW